MKKTHGEGTIIRRENGRWQASLQVDGERKSVYGRTRKEVVQKLDELKRQATAAGRLPGTARRTLNDLLDRWLEVKGPSWRPKTAYDYTWLCDAHIRIPLGYLRLNKVTPERIQRVYTTLQERGQHRMAQRVHRVLNQVFRLAVKWGWVANNPCDRVEPPRYHPPRREVWSLEQTRYFLEATRNSEFGPLWVVAICTGCRVGELLALTWDDVEFGANTLSITKTRQRINGQWLTLPPKTRSGQRVISLPALASRALADQWERRGHSELVFPYSAEKVCKALRAECERLGLPRLTPHGLAAFARAASERLNIAAAALHAVCCDLS